MQLAIAATLLSTLFSFGLPSGIYTQESVVNATDSRLGNVLFQVHQTEARDNLILGNPELIKPAL